MKYASGSAIAVSSSAAAPASSSELREGARVAAWRNSDLRVRRRA